MGQSTFFSDKSKTHTVASKTQLEGVISQDDKPISF